MVQVKKHKATIKFDEDLWIKLQNIAAIQNTSVTAILTSFAESYVNDKLPEDYEKRIQDKVYKVLDLHIESDIIEAIAIRVAYRLGIQKKVIDVSGSKVGKIYNEPAIRAIYDTDDTDDTDIKTIDTDSTDSTDNKIQLTEEEKRQQNISKFKHYEASSNKRSYDDDYVAAQESTNKRNISRYRRGVRSPDQKFIDKWGLNWNQERWIRNEVEK